MWVRLQGVDDTSELSATPEGRCEPIGPIPYGPFIGVGGAIVMVTVLLMSDTFSGNTTVPRWRHPQWLAWLAATQPVDAKKSLRDQTRRAIPRRSSGSRQR